MDNAHKEYFDALCILHLFVSHKVLKEDIDSQLKKCDELRKKWEIEVPL